ncbi:MAG: hypothetical protein BWY69_00338 [Planctomycetes bacterium ADurb.Bin401]|nr:MAG: hypothetical protein BWY69_00338 [Planctomycetes bacterium ADurb.Bin401]
MKIVENSMNKMPVLIHIGRDHGNIPPSVIFLPDKCANPASDIIHFKPGFGACGNFNIIIAGNLPNLLQIKYIFFEMSYRFAILKTVLLGKNQRLVNLQI